MTANRPVSVTAASVRGANRARAGAERFVVAMRRSGLTTAQAARVLRRHPWLVGRLR